MYHIKNDKRSTQSSQFIYKALSALMEEQDFDSIRITALVKKAQVSRATFYRNFDAKIDVLTYISDQTFEGMLAYFIEYRKENVVTRSSEFTIPFLKYFDTHSKIVEQLIQANRQDILSNSLKKLFETFHNQLKKTADSPDDSWDYFVAIRAGITINILVTWIQKGKKIKPTVLGALIDKQLKSSFTVDQFL